MRRVSPVALAAPVVLAALLALSGCGSGHPSGTATQGPQAAELYAAARHSAMAASSAHVTGASTSGGVTSTLDLSGNRDGTNQRVLLGSPKDGSVEIRVVDGTTYLKGDRTYWTAQADARTAAAVSGRFVRLPGDQARARGTTLASILTTVFPEDQLSATDVLNSTVARRTVDGRPAYVLTQRVGGDGARMSVSTDARHDLLRVDGTSKKPGTLHFSGWNTVPEVTAPAADQIATLPSR